MQNDRSKRRGNKIIKDLREDFVQVIEKALEGCKLIPRHYQMRAALKAIYYKRMIAEHCTSSGKSLTMALYIHYLKTKYPEKKFLVLVPRLDLIEQLTENFLEFNIKPEELDMELFKQLLQILGINKKEYHQ